MNIVQISRFCSTVSLWSPFPLPIHSKWDQSRSILAHDREVHFDGYAVATGSKIKERPEVLHIDKAFVSAALYDSAKKYGPLTGAAGHSGTPYGAQSLHDAMPAFFGGHCFFGSVL